MMRIEHGNGWTMVCGESFAWLCEQPDASFDALVTDPPYSSGGFVRGDRMVNARTKYVVNNAKHDLQDFSGDNRDQRGYLAWCAMWLSESLRLLRPGSPACVFTDWRQLPITTDAFQAGGFVWRGVGVWTKNNGSRPQMGRFRSDAEFLVWGSAGPMRSGEDVGCLAGAWTAAPVPGIDREHITEKPVEVMTEIVRIAPPGGIVLDPFAGSGSTGVAALRVGRRFVGIEKSPHYFDTACTRLRAEETNSTAQAIRDGQASLF